jgi:hypothetical protein
VQAAARVPAWRRRRRRLRQRQQPLRQKRRSVGTAAGMVQRCCCLPLLQVHPHPRAAGAESGSPPQMQGSCPRTQQLHVQRGLPIHRKAAAGAGDRSSPQAVPPCRRRPHPQWSGLQHEYLPCCFVPSRSNGAQKRTQQQRRKGGEEEEEKKAGQLLALGSKLRRSGAAAARHGQLRNPQAVGRDRMRVGGGSSGVGRQ